MMRFVTVSDSTYEAHVSPDGSGIVAKVATNVYVPPDYQSVPVGETFRFALCDIRMGERALFLNDSGDPVLNTSPVKRFT